MTTQAGGAAAADTIAQAAAAALAAYQKLMSLAVPLTPPPAVAPPPPPPPPVTDFAWAVAQMQAGHQLTRPGWGDKAVFIGSAGQELMRLPQGFPTGGLVVPWLYAPGDVTALDWEVAT